MKNKKKRLKLCAKWAVAFHVLFFVLLFFFDSDASIKKAKQTITVKHWHIASKTPSMTNTLKKPPHKIVPSPNPQPTLLAKTPPPSEKSVAITKKIKPIQKETPKTPPVVKNKEAPAIKREVKANKEAAIASLKKALATPLADKQPSSEKNNPSASEIALIKIDEDFYREGIQALLEKSLRLPERKKTFLSLTIHRNGKVKRCVVKNGPSLNRRYLEEKLFHLQFEPFGKLFPGESEHTFIVELDHD